MRSAHRFRQQLVRWINPFICLVVVLSCLAIVPLRLGNPNSFAQGLDSRDGPGSSLIPTAGSVRANLAKDLLAASLTVAALGVGGAQARQTLPSQSRRSPISIEAEDLVRSARASAGRVDRQEMQNLGPGWSGNAQLFWGAPAPVDRPMRNWPSLSLSFNPPTTGKYEIVLHYTTAPDFGSFHVFLDGQPAADIDGYSPTLAPQARSLGQYTLNSRTQLVVTVFSKARASRGFFVGLDRIELRPVDAALPNIPGRPVDPGPRRRPLPGVQPPGSKAQPDQSNVQPIAPGVITRAVCAASPETCCPKGVLSEGCKLVAEGLLDIRIRSYVPPRFTELGYGGPWEGPLDVANIVSDRNVSGPFKAWPGCRFNVNDVSNILDNNKDILKKAGELLEATLHQWSGGVESAKDYISQNVANEVCKVVDDSQSCRDKLAPIVKTGINLGLASLGIPPEIPDIQQLREHGIQYIAAQAASYALGDPGILNKLPLDEQQRNQLYQQAYDKVADGLAKELDKALPTPNFKSDNPATWGHLEPAYAPHNAHVYVEVKVKPGGYPKYIHFLTKAPTHKWPPLYLDDTNHVYKTVGPMEIPTFIPTEGVILPLELKPFFEADNTADKAGDQIPGVTISQKWLTGKFGLSTDGIVRGQLNFIAAKNTYGWSDWDLFYNPIFNLQNVNDIRKSQFRLHMPFGSKGVLYWVTDWNVKVAAVFDTDVGYGVLDEYKKLRPYYGRIDPAPRCDGKPNSVYVKEYVK